MGKFFSDLFGKCHFVPPADEIRAPLIMSLCVLISLIILLVCSPRVCQNASSGGANQALAPNQNGEPGGIPLQNAVEFQQNIDNVNPAVSTNAPLINPNEFREINPEPPSYSNSISINDSDEDSSNSHYATINPRPEAHYATINPRPEAHYATINPRPEAHYATIRPRPETCYATLRPRPESSCRLPKFIGPTSGSGRSSLSGPLNVSTIREDKRVRFANRQSGAAPSNVRQSAFGLFIGDELNAEELNFDLFRRRSSTDAMDDSSLWGESNVNVECVRDISVEPYIPPADYEEPFIPPIDYNEEPSIPSEDYRREFTINLEGLSRTDYVVDGASGGSENLNLRTDDNEEKLDDLIEEAIGSLDEVLEAACISNTVITDPQDKVENNSYGGVKIIKMIPKK